MRTIKSVKDLILGVIHCELTSEIEINRQVKIRERIFEVLKEEGNLIIPSLTTDDLVDEYFDYLKSKQEKNNSIKINNQ